MTGVDERSDQFEECYVQISLVCSFCGELGSKFCYLAARARKTNTACVYIFPKKAETSFSFFVLINNLSS